MGTNKNKAHQLAVLWWELEAQASKRERGWAVCDQRSGHQIPVGAGYLCNPNRMGDKTPDLVCEECFDRLPFDPWDGGYSGLKSGPYNTVDQAIAELDPNRKKRRREGKSSGMRILCPHYDCRQPILIEPNQIGTEAVCPSCRRQFRCPMIRRSAAVGIILTMIVGFVGLMTAAHLVNKARNEAPMRKVEITSDQLQLFEIAVAGSNPEAETAALAKLERQDLVDRVAREGGDFISRKALERVKDPAVLADIALAPGEGPERRRTDILAQLRALNQRIPHPGWSDSRARALAQLELALETVPEEHRMRLRESLFPALSLLLHTRVADIVGEVAEIKIIWDKREFRYDIGGMVGGERVLCRISCSRLEGGICQADWETDWPKTFTANSYFNLFREAPINRELHKLLEPVLKGLPTDELEDLTSLEFDWPVRCAAVLHLANESLIQEMALRDPVPFVRETASRRLADQTVLARIAVEDGEPSVRFAAMKAMTDLSRLDGLHIRDSDRHGWEAVRAELRETPVKAGSQTQRSPASNHTNKTLATGDAAEAAVRAITDPDTLADAALSHEHWRGRAAAVPRVADRNLIRRIAESDPHPGVRKVASEKLEAWFPTKIREWTHRDGRRILGRVMSLNEEAGTVEIEIEGTLFRDFPVGEFSNADQAILGTTSTRAR